jgi:hypothetical protein
MVLFIIKYGVVFAAGFVAGILIGRKNKALVETSVTKAKQAESAIADKIQKKQ